jgi:xanthine dehydrogenase accessory factor
MVAGAPTFEHPKDVFERLLEWQDADQATALVFITGTEGGAVRARGAVLAVSPDQSVGYISGGCIDADVILQARQAIETSTNKALRYGAGSPFVDLPLPCGGAIEVLIVSHPSHTVLRAATERLQNRNSASLTVSEIDGLHSEEQSGASATPAHMFTYFPKLRMRIAGRGTDAVMLAKMAHAAGYETHVQLLDEDDVAAASAFESTSIARLETPGNMSETNDDAWTAFVLLFHDTTWEVPLLRQALAGPAFYIGAVGSKRTHERRCSALRDAGISEPDIQRVRGPIGLVPSLRDASMLAISTLAEIIDAFPGKAIAKRPVTAFVLLAAGASARFGDGDKLLAPLHGRPLLQHVAGLAASIPDVLRFAVVREADTARTTVLENNDWTVLENQNAALGQSTSLKRAMEVIGEQSEIDQIVILLGDMPLVEQVHISDLLAAAEPADVSAVLSCADERCAPPALFKREHFDRLLNLTGDQGAKQIFESIDVGAITLPIDPDALRDVDTLDDLARMKETALA